MRAFPFLVLSCVLVAGCGDDDEVPVEGDSGIVSDGGRDAGADDDAGPGDPCADVDCSELDGPCLLGVCDPRNGSCLTTIVPEDTVCDDGNPCTANDACNAGGSCTGETMDCTSLDDECVRGQCDVATGTCGAVPAASGASCDDGNRCTTGDTCDGLGACVSTPLDCSGLDDQCNMGVCNMGSGACEAIPVTDGLTCDDLNGCTSDDVCSSGVCGGTALADGGFCDDGNACTVGDQCIGGTCSTTPVDCSFLDSMCRTGVCSPLTGFCTALNRPSGTPCSDGNRCTTGDACDPFGACRASPVDCSGLDRACGTGVCNRGTGDCEVVDHVDGVPCDDFEMCTTGDACAAGACVGTALADGTSCTDSDLCTTSDACVSGSCTGTPVTCSSPMTCDPGTGSCS